MPHFDQAELDSISALFEKGTYFDTVSAFHTHGHPIPGMEGEIIPYLLRNDICVSALLVVSFLLISYVMGKGRLLIYHQIKELFVERKHSALFDEAGADFRYQFFMISNTVILQGVVFYALCLKPGNHVVTTPTWQLLLLSIGACSLLMICRYLAYSFVNWLFFDKGKRERWMDVYSLLVSLQGVLLFPLACLTVYFNFDSQQALIVLLLVLIVAKLLLFTKGMDIFFVKMQGFLCNILYFCTLEMIPLLFLIKIISEINHSWTLNL